MRETRETWPIGKTDKARHKRDKRDLPHRKERQHGRDKERRHGHDTETQHGHDKDRQHGRDKEKQHGRDKERQHGRDKDRQHGRDKDRQHGLDKERQHGQDKDPQHGRDKETCRRVCRRQGLIWMRHTDRGCARVRAAGDAGAVPVLSRNAVCSAVCVCVRKRARARAYRYLHLWRRRRRAQGHACTCERVRGRHVMTCRARVVGSGKGACGTIMEGEEEIAMPWRSNAGYIGCSWFCSWRSNAA
jgi:hypothetical protein